MKVLLAHDGQPPSDEARKLLIKLADRKRVDVTVVCVESFDMALEVGARTEGKYSLEAGRKYAESVVERTVEELRGEGFQVSGLVREGHPPFEILTQIESGRHELAVLGTGKAGRLGQVVLGSASTKVLHASLTSVLIVHKADEGQDGRILVGIDGSDASESAVHAVGELCDPQRVKIHLSAAIRLSDAAVLGGDWAGLASKGRDELLALLRSQAENDLARARKSLEERGFAVTENLVEGNPAEQLLMQADEGNVDVVAVGSRGRTTLERVLLGSVTDRIVRQSSATLVGRQTA
ncbi:hypothetical protein BH20ACT23_BH20ACT23_17140 [soil metagenome]